MSQETKILIAVVLVSVVALIGGAIYFTKTSPTETGETVEVSKTLSDDSYKIGSPSASVKIAEYADFQCPACAASNPIVNEMLKQNADTVYFEYHHFPLPAHRWADKAAEAAEAAGAQGKFFEYHDTLFSKQNEWAESSNAVEFFKKYAQEMNLDTKKFNEELDSGKYRERVLASKNQGTSLNVNATPTFFVNGKRIEGGMRLDDWKKVIEDASKTK